jgi:hypothetical protein
MSGLRRLERAPSRAGVERRTSGPKRRAHHATKVWGWLLFEPQRQRDSGRNGILPRPLLLGNLRQFFPTYLFISFSKPIPKEPLARVFYEFKCTLNSIMNSNEKDSRSTCKEYSLGNLLCFNQAQRFCLGRLQVHMGTVLITMRRYIECGNTSYHVSSPAGPLCIASFWKY